MFGKILRAGKGGQGLKYKIDVQVTQLENLPTSIKKCRVVWARSAKMQITDVKDVRGSVASFKQTLTQVTTIYRDKGGKLEPKEYEFKVQVPGKSSSDASVTIGKATLDMAKYCKDETTSQVVMLPITFKVGGSATGYIKMTITTIFLGDSNEDGMTEVSGLTGLTSDHGSIREQDLDGFVDEEGKFTKKSKSKRDDGSGAAASASTSGRSSAKAEGTRRRRPLPPTAEEDASDMDEQEPEPVPAPAKLSKKKSHRTAEAEVAPAEEQDANPFAKKVTKAPAKKPAPKLWEDDEDISPLNSDVSDSEPPPPKAKSTRMKEPEESFEDMKSSLFSTKKASDRAVGASGSAASSVASKATSSKAGKAPTPPPVEEDEESLRNDLFSAKPKAAAAAPFSKAAPVKAAAGVAALGVTAAEAATSGHHKHRSKHAAAPPPPPADEEADEYDDDLGPSTSAPAPAVTHKSRSRVAEVAEVSAVKGATALPRVGSSKHDTSKGGSAQELEELRQRVSQLEKQLADEQAAKDDLSRKMQKYVDKIADLEDQLAEGDVTELFAQMKEMEAKYQAEIKDMEAKYQAEIKELMDRHLAEMAEMEERHQTELEELQEEAVASSSRGRGQEGASADELKRLQSELREQEALLKSRTAKLEAEQAAANAARQAAESKLAEANNMIDDSLLVATRHQQENKALQEEITRLKRQLEDASAWNTTAAVAAVTSAANQGRRASDDEELEELREKLEELQEENARLQKLSEATQQAAAEMLRDVHALLRDQQGLASFKRSADTSSLGQLAVGLRYLCEAFTVKSTELRDTEARLEELSRRAEAARSSGGGNADGGAKVKPHELLSRVQLLTSERDMLQEQLGVYQQSHTDLAAAQQLAAQLQAQVDQLIGEKEAVERLKVATIADLRRQNDELRSNLRSLSASANVSPRHLYDEGEATEMQAASRALTGASEAAGNWNEFESLVSQLKSDRSELHRQVEQLKADNASLSKQVHELRTTAGVAAAGMLAGATAFASSDRPSDHYRTEEMEQLQAEVTRLQAQVAELSEAETVIKEWSDYADTLVTDKTRLEEQVQELNRRLAAGATATTLELSSAARRSDELRRSLADAEERARSLERRALAAETQVQELTRLLDIAEVAQLDAQRKAEESALRALAAERRAVDAEARAELAERSADEARSTAIESGRRALEAEQKVEEASRYQQDQPAFYAVTKASPHGQGFNPQSQPADTAEVMELRHEISRLEASLSGLRIQLIESQSRTVSAGGDIASSSRTRHRDLTAGKDALPRSGKGRPQSDDQSMSSACSEDLPSPGPPSVLSERGWHAEVEQLRARNASLEAVVAGLHTTIASLQEENVAGGNSRGSRRAERQLQEVQGRLATALQEKAELESTIVLLRSELEQAPLVHTSRDAGGVELAGSIVVAGVPASLAAEVARLQSEVERLQEEKDDAERSVQRLSDEMEELAEALDASNNENERLSFEVLTLRDQVEQLEGGDNAGSDRSRSTSSSGGRERGSRRDSEASDRNATGPLKLGAAVAERELAAAWEAARELIRQVKSGSGGGDGFGDAPAFSGLTDQQDLAHALNVLRAQITELQRQSRQARQVSATRTASNAAGTANTAAVVAAEAQLAKANARIDELEQLLEDAEIENQHLTEQLEECLTGGRKGADSVGSVAEECQSSYGGSAGAATGTSNPYSYGHANTLTLAAFEQRLAMAEGRRDELSVALEEATASNRRLEADVSSLQQQLAAVRRGQDLGALGDLDRPYGQVPARSRGSRSASDSEDGFKKRIDELQAANRKLEAVCHDLEEKAQLARDRSEQLHADLETAHERIQELEASVESLQKRLEDEAAGGGRLGKEKVADLESRVARLSREKAALEEQLEDERARALELEDTLKDKLDRDGDDEAAETVAAFEVKYNRLKERYKMLEESSQEEIEELTDQLNEALAQVPDLQRQIKQLQTQLSQNRTAGVAAAASGANMEELRNLRSENERLVQQLVAKTMELAELSESEITMKRELSRVHEINMKLAQKATTLEAQVAMAQAATAKAAKGGKK